MDDVIMDRRTEEAPVQDARLKVRKKKKKRVNSSFLNYLFNLFACCLITVSFLGMDFVLFASSGPINVFSGSSLRPEVLYLLIGIAAAVLAVYFCLSFLSIILYLLTGLATGFCTYAMVNQFANFNTDGTVGSSGTFGAVAVGVAVFAVLALTPKRYKALLVMTAVFCFGAVLVNQNVERSEFVTDPEMKPVLAADAEPGQKTVTVMIANAPSYSYINSLSNTEAAEPYKKRLMQIMLGFYAKNGFRLYPNAYVTNGNQFINAARSLNYAAGEEISFLQNQVLREGYWQFKNREDFEAYLKDNAVYDKLKEKGFKISAYQSHGINLCKKDNADAVDRCVSKINFPSNIDPLKLTTAEKMQVLFAQWLESTGWFNGEGFMKTIYGYLKPLYNPAKTPVIGTSYKNLYVLNSFKNLELMLNDMAADKGANAYFVYLDLPADMFVYDDMCRLKPTEEWLPKRNQPWADNKAFLEKRNAYLKQTMCLFGQLEKMMQAIRKLPGGDKTTVVIEGLSGVDDLVGTDNQDLSDRFRNAQMVALAVRAAGSRQFVINKSICPTEEILNNLFNGGPKCTEFGRTKLSKSTKKAVKESVDAVRFTNDIAQKSLQEFNRWYKEWNKVNYQAPLVSPLTVSTQPLKASEAPAAAAPSALPPLEEKAISEQKVTDKEVKVGEEAKVESLAKASEEPVAAE